MIVRHPNRRVGLNVDSVRDGFMQTAVAALAAAILLALAFARIAASSEDASGSRDHGFQQTVEVRDVRAEPDQVSGVLVNLSSKVLRGVKVRIDRAWHWTDERHPGEDSPGRSNVYDVPGDIPPGGRLTFTYRAESPLPQRSDGRFDTSVAVVGLEQVG